MKTRTPFTLAIIGINSLVFIIVAWKAHSLTFTTNESILTVLMAGGNLNPFTLGGEPWRIFTAMFLHLGIIHLAVNMYGLWQLGSLLEPGIGWERFILLYVICGLAASIASLFFNVMVISAGASGAIFGLYGFLLGAELISTYHDWEKLKRVLLNFVIFAAINLLIAGQVSVDMSGHIGGMITGIVISLCHFKLNILKSWRSMLVVALLIPFAILAVPTGQRDFYRLVQSVYAQEDETNSILAENKNDVLLDSLKLRDEKWDELLTRLESLQKLPAAMNSDRTTMSSYLKLRKRESGYRIQVMGQTYIYLDSLASLKLAFDTLKKLRHNYVFTINEKDQLQDDTVQENMSPQLPLIKVLFNNNWKETSDSSYTYYRIGSRDSLGYWQGPVRDYYRDGKVQMKGVYKNGMRDGVFIFYSDHNTYTSAGRYEDEYSVGKWQTFYWNGRLRDEVFYGKYARTENVWDSLGNQIIDDGRGTFKDYYANGQLREEGVYSSGLRKGFWYGYREDGKPYYKESYENNRLIKGVSMGKDGRQYVYDESSEVPSPARGLKDYQKYLSANLHYPSGETRHGLVTLLFNVGVDGSLWDFVITEGLTPAINAEAIRLVREGPAWIPARLHGQEFVQSQGYVEIRF